MELSHQIYKYPYFVIGCMKPAAIVLLLLGIIIFFAIFYSLAMKVQIMVQEEMEVTLTPTALFLTTPYSDNVSVDFVVVVDNSVVCNEYCVGTLRDLSDNIVLFNDSIAPGNHTFVLPINRRGEGQKIFSYSVTCHNIKTNICISEEKNYTQTSLITVDYTLPPEERMIKDVLSQELPNYFEDLGTLDRLFKKQTQLLDLLPGEQRYGFEYTQEIARALTILDLWRARKYTDLLGSYDISVLVNDFSNYVDFLESRIYRYNEIVNLLNIVSSDKFQDAKRFYVGEDIYYTFQDLESTAVLIDLSLPDVESIDSQAASFESNLTFALDIYDRDLSSFLNISSDLWETHALAQKKLGRFVVIYDNYSTYSSFCEALDNYNEKTILDDEVAFLNRKSFYGFLDPDGLLDNATIIYFDSLKNDSPFVLPEIYESVPRLDGNGTFNLSTITDWNNITRAFSLSLCPEVLTSPPFIPSSTLIDTNFTPVVAETFVLPDNPRECCVFGKCESCCEPGECLENQPLIFVHGHAISKGNQPEQSHRSFSLLQNMFEEEGYVNAGKLGADDIPSGVWGEMPTPITIRVSYYYLSYYDLGQYKLVTRKSDSIETYAIRLKELIDEVLLRTGKDKADIVAHSMGGLVVREYIDLFGDDKLDTVILIGTPNYGVEGRIGNFCSIVGSSRECSEMRAGSIFLKKLNIDSNTFENGYTITATGCDMDGEDGDGIVLARNVPLPFTENLFMKGECTDALNSNLHQQMLNPNIYPEIYDLIRNIVLY